MIANLNKIAADQNNCLNDKIWQKKITKKSDVKVTLTNNNKMAVWQLVT